MIIGNYIWPFITAFGLAIILTPAIKLLALRWGIVDRPAPRKIHTAPTPLLGGVAIFLAVSITVLLYVLLGQIIDQRISLPSLLMIFFGATMIMIGGFLDDKYNLTPSRQIVFPIIAALLVLLSGIKIQFVTNPLGGVLEFSAIIGSLLAFFWLLGMMYTTKLLDGLDGLVAGVTTIGSLIIFVVSLFWDMPFSGTGVLSLILAGAALGFLVFNWHPAKIFLGEGGSIFCGFILGVLSIISGSKIATALLIMGIPILDMVWVIIRRLWQGSSPTIGDNKHLHFRLLDIGLTHRQAVGVLLLLTGGFGATAIFLNTRGKIIALVTLAVIMVALVSALVAAYNKKSTR